MAAIGGLRSDLSITRKTDGNFGNVSAGVLFSKLRISENGGKDNYDVASIWSENMLGYLQSSQFFSSYALGKLFASRDR